MKIFNEQQDQDRIMQFLMGLNDSYSAIRGQTLLMNPLPTVRKTYSLITQEDKQCKLSSGVSENFSMAAVTQSRFNNFKNTKGHCDYCNRDRHTIANYRTLLYHCDYCDKDGHTQDICHKLHCNNVGSTRGHDSHKSGRRPSQSGCDSRKGQRNNFSPSGCDSI